MLIWAIIATIACILLTLTLAAYRRQVRETCRHMAFITGNTTNMLLPSNLPFKELDELNDRLNDVLASVQRMKSEQAAGDKQLKDAVTNISHDIRTPLTSLDGYFQLLVRSDSEEERKKYITIIEERIDSLKYMLEELFTYTKLRNESLELQLDKIDFTKCVCDTLFSFYEDMHAKDIEPSISFCDEQIIVNGNVEAIKRVVQNVLKNALEHGTGCLSLSTKREEGRAVFICTNEVSNPNELDISRVFTRFYKVDPARTHSSTGLGLAIAKELAEKMNGNLTASLKGSLFSIQFTV